MEKYINKGFDTLAELTLFLNEKAIPKDNIIHIGVNASNSDYQLIFVKQNGRSRL